MGWENGRWRANEERVIDHVVGRTVLMAYGIPRLKKNRLIL
jgi:hypothetical protein